MAIFNIISTFVLCWVVLSVFSMPSNKNKNAHIEPYGLSDTINGTIEGIRKDIPEPIEISGEFNITVPDEFAEIIAGDLGISNIRISGINGFLLPYLSVSTTKAQLTFVLPTLNIDAGYIADINVLKTLPIYGNGTANIDLVNLQIKVNAGLQLIPMQITDLSLDIELQAIKIDIGGLSDNEEFSKEISGLITGVANDVVLPYINNNSKEIGEQISGPIKDIINGLLNGTSIMDANT